MGGHFLGVEDGLVGGLELGVGVIGVSGVVVSVEVWEVGGCDV